MGEEVNDSLKVNLKDNGGILDFKSLEEIRTWYNEEFPKFNWTQNLRVNATNQVWSHINTRFSQLNSQLNTAIQNKSRKTPIKGNLDQIENWFMENYVNNEFLLASNSAKYKYIEPKIEENKIHAAIAFGQLIGANIFASGIEKTEYLETAFDAYLYKKGISTSLVEPERESLQELRGKWEGHLDEFKTREEALESDFVSIKTNIETFFETKGKEATDFFEKHDGELNDLKKTYDQYMAIKAPVDYWEEKKTYHGEMIPKFKNWAIGVGSIGAVLLGLIIWQTITETSPPLWKIGVVIIFATLLFWALRILTRILLSHIHLESDAYERVTMAKTYLSLIRDESGLEENDKKLILSTLFRPSSTGVIKDDGLPPGIYDLATKLGTK